ncbi:hypothetical protein G7K_6854-t1 [Saitoella complicata NRRL Y-17804]|uniref:dihydroxy-acid dehydratase n=1 Tax=Saitoella complicata (strain BCRC 22490 / CBS 7301 / JCM 7358 / NBRC 10748 / NRRL Y-17804) TaxID=698492 RepID=A0A0E9NSB4_SAICN|nr:hypothetical protein G7K_6854-t1 [Saitoella complicata NRRL Y-17804]
MAHHLAKGDVARDVIRDDLIADTSLPARPSHFCQPGSLNKFSSTITQDLSQGGSQSMLYAIGLRDHEMDQPQIGIGSVWYSGNPCNSHLLELSENVKKAVKDARMVPMQFNTIGVSDAISMGTTGMRFSLQSREIIADSFETIMSAQWYDAMIAIPGCDKNMPAVLMAMARLNRPSIMLYGGAIQQGRRQVQPGASGIGKKDGRIDINDTWDAYGAFVNQTESAEGFRDVIRNACPGPGACGGQYTASTMATAAEAMGMSLPGSASNPAGSPEKLRECAKTAEAIKVLMEKDIKPLDIMTKPAFENAITMTMLLGGSTNSVLHLLAIASSANVDLSLDDFHRISAKTPLLADMKPSGNFYMTDLHELGGMPAIMKFLSSFGFLNGSIMTVTGRTLAENLKSAPSLPQDQVAIRPATNPIKETGHIRILYGNLAPGGAVAKITGKEGLEFRGKARCFDSERDLMDALDRKEIKREHGNTVIIVRYEGPKGGPGMPEMLKPGGAIQGLGLNDCIALVTDGRYSGASRGFIIGHVCPEAQDGGPIALVKDGDEVVIDSVGEMIDVLGVSEEEWERRRKEWVKPPLRVKRGTLLKYAKLVRDASHGCVTDLAEDW